MRRLQFLFGGERDSNDDTSPLSKLKKALSKHDAALIAALMPEIVRILAVWPNLPPTVRAAILLLTEQEKQS